MTIKAQLQTNAVATDTGITFNVAELSKVGLQVVGITNATVSFEATIDGTNWVALAVTPAAGGAAVTSVTADGLVIASVSGLLLIRTRVSAWTSGTINVYALGNALP